MEKNIKTQFLYVAWTEDSHVTQQHKNTTFSNLCAAWLKDSLSVLVGWIIMEVRLIRLKVSTRLWVGGGVKQPSTVRVCVSVCVCPQVVCGCQVPSCQGQTDILSSAASPAWARLVPPDHVTAFSQYKQPYITHQLIPARYKCGSAWTLQLSLTENDRNGMCQLNILVHFNRLLTYIYSIINYIWPVICLHNALRKIICYILLL